ncbi:dTDP-4-dehydrorhamnose 3,5-epimerase family protein [Bacteroides sp.]
MDKMIEGVFITPLKQIFHPKGDIFHALKNTESSFYGFGEAYFSTIRPLMVKAWKRHFKMTLNLICIKGEICFVLYDGRKESRSYGQFMEVTLSPSKNYCRLTVPPNVWMGFKGMDEMGDSLLLNVANIPHDPTEQENIPVEESSIVFDWNKLNTKV